MAVSITHELEATSEHMRSLRGMIEWLRASGRLLETDAVVDPDLEITGVQKHFDGSYPILFKNVKGHPHLECVTNLYAKMDIIEDLFGWKDPQERTRRLAHAITHPIPLTMCFGLPPAATLIAGGGFDYVVLPRGGDELGAAGAVQGFPIRIVKARTVDAWAVADCDLVLEGHLYPRDKRYETREAEEADTQGRYPFHPEWAGYMGKAYKAPTFHVTGITMRKSAKPLIYALGVHMLDCNNIDTTVREAAIYELCERLQPGIIQDVNIPFCMTDCGGCIIQVKKRNKIEEGWQRNFLAAILACNQGMRLAIAVDTDVDMYSMDDIMWCLTTRVNPHTDILNPIPGGIGQTFQPQERLTAGDKEWTASNTRFEGGMGIDATLPYGYEKDFQRPVYPIERIALGKWFSAKDIERAKSQMRGWVESLARTGR